MKLALLVLTRKEIGVKIRSGSEQWVSRIDFSSNFNSNLLMIDTSPCVYRNSIQIDIIGLNEESWNNIKDRVIYLMKPNANEYIQIGNNKLFLSDRFKNCLYSKGIYVGCLPPGKFKFGYDLYSISLDRDRRLVDPYDLQYAIKTVLCRAFEQEKISPIEMFDLLLNDYEESKAFDGGYYSDTLQESITKIFQEKFGDDVLPMIDTLQSIEASAMGFNTVIVSKAIKNIIENVKGTYESKKNERKFDTSKLYSASELSEEEKKNFIWAFKLVSVAESQVNNLTVVDFIDEKVLGLYKAGVIYVAKKIMLNRVNLIEICIHEAAHHYGDDGNRIHDNAQHIIAAKIITNLSENNHG